MPVLINFLGNPFTNLYRGHFKHLTVLSIMPPESWKKFKGKKKKAPNFTTEWEKPVSLDFQIWACY